MENIKKEKHENTAIMILTFEEIVHTLAAFTNEIIEKKGTGETEKTIS